MRNRRINNGNSDRLDFLGFQNHYRWWLQPWNENTLAPWKKNYDQTRQHIKKRRFHFANRGPSSQNDGFSSSHMWVWYLDYTASWVPKNWYFLIVVLEKTLERPLDCKKIKPVNPKGNLSWIFIGWTDAEAETPILWPPDAKKSLEKTHWLTGKDSDAGKEWRQEEKGTAEDEMVGWHHRLGGYKFEQVLEVGNGQDSLVSFSPQGHK